MKTNEYSLYKYKHLPDIITIGEVAMYADNEIIAIRHKNMQTMRIFLNKEEAEELLIFLAAWINDEEFEDRK